MLCVPVSSLPEARRQMGFSSFRCAVELCTDAIEFHARRPSSLTIEKGPAVILQAGSFRRVLGDADRSVELRFRRRMHHGSLGNQFSGRQARADDAPQRPAGPARGAIGPSNGLDARRYPCGPQSRSPDRTAKRPWRADPAVTARCKQDKSPSSCSAVTSAVAWA